MPRRVPQKKAKEFVLEITGGKKAASTKRRSNRLAKRKKRRAEKANKKKLSNNNTNDIMKWQKFAITLKQKESLKALRTLVEDNNTWKVGALSYQRSKSNEKETERKLNKINKRRQSGNYGDEDRVLDFIKNNLTKDDIQGLKKQKKILKQQGNVKKQMAKQIMIQARKANKQLDNYNGLFSKKNVSEKEKQEAAEKAIDESLKLRGQVYLLDKTLMAEITEKKKRKETSILIDERSKEFSEQFKNNPKVCDEERLTSREDMLKCLLEQGMVYATALFAADRGSKYDRHLGLICNTLAHATSNPEMLQKNAHKLGKMLQTCLARIQIKMFDQARFLDDDEEDLIDLMRDVPVLDAIHGTENVKFKIETYMKIFDIVQRLENSITIREEDIKKDVKLALRVEEQYQQLNNAWGMWGFQFGATLMSLYAIYYGLSQTEDENLRPRLPENTLRNQTTWQYVFGKPVDKATRQSDFLDNVVAPIVGIGAAVWGSWGFAQIMTQRVAVPIAAKVFYGSPQQRVKTSAMAYELALENNRNLRNEAAQDGGQQMVEALTAVMLMLQVQDNFNQVQAELDAQRNALIVTTAATIAGGIGGGMYGGLEGARRGATFGAGAISGLSTQLLQYSRGANRLNRLIAAMVSSGIHASVTMFLRRTNNINERVAQQFGRRFEKNTNLINSYTDQISNQVGLMGKQVSQGMQQVLNNAAEATKMTAIKDVNQGRTCSLCKERGCQRNSLKCKRRPEYLQMKQMAVDEGVSIAEVFNQWETLNTDAQYDFYVDAVREQGQGDAHVMLRGQWETVNNIVRHVEGDVLDADDDGDIVIALLKATLFSSPVSAQGINHLAEMINDGLKF